SRSSCATTGRTGGAVAVGGTYTIVSSGDHASGGSGTGATAGATASVSCSSVLGIGIVYMSSASAPTTGGVSTGSSIGMGGDDVRAAAGALSGAATGEGVAAKSGSA